MPRAGPRAFLQLFYFLLQVTFLNQKRKGIFPQFSPDLGLKVPPSGAIVGFLSLLATPRPRPLGLVWVRFFQTKAGVLGTVSGISFLSGTHTTPNKIR